MTARPRRRPGLRASLLFLARMVRKFRWTLLLLGSLVALGGVLFALTPHAQFGGRPPLLLAFLSAWMAMFAQPVIAPDTWYLDILCGLYPLFGFVLVGEGIVRLGMLIVSREHGATEWMEVMAATHRDHVILCGLGHLGYRILGQLVDSGTPVVAIEKDANARFLPEARRSGAPILVRDMKEDQALLDAGIQHARAIIIAANDDMANLEVALDARRMNPRIRIIMRLFDQAIANKLQEAKLIDEAFSSAALAAPVVADMARRALGAREP